MLRSCGNHQSCIPALTWILWISSQFFQVSSHPHWRRENWHLPFRRTASRTTIFRRAMDGVLFKGKRLRDLQGRKPLLIINAAELRTGSAFYFTANEWGPGGSGGLLVRTSRSHTR